MTDYYLNILVQLNGTIFPFLEFRELYDSCRSNIIINKLIIRLDMILILKDEIDLCKISKNLRKNYYKKDGISELTKI